MSKSSNFFLWYQDITANITMTTFSQATLCACYGCRIYYRLMYNFASNFHIGLNAGERISISCIRMIRGKLNLKGISHNSQRFVGGCCTSVFCNLISGAVIDKDIVIITLYAGLIIKGNNQRLCARISKCLCFIQIVAIIMRTLRIQGRINRYDYFFSVMHIDFKFGNHTRYCDYNSFSSRC